MSRLIPYFKLIRIHNCLLAAAGVAIGAWMTWLEPHILATVLTAAATFSVCAAANIINDMRDIEIDRRNRPTRVLVTGAVDLSSALRLAIVFQLIAIVLAAVVDWTYVLAIVVAASLLVQAYNLRLKSIPVVGNVVIAFLGGLTFLTGGYAVNPALVWVLPGPLVPAVFAFLLHWCREIVKDAEDVNGDRAAGVRTLPQIIGVQRAVAIVLALALGLVVAAVLPALFGWFNVVYRVIAVYIVGMPMLGLLILVWGNPTPGMLRLASTALKAAMLLGAVALLAGS